MTGTFTGPRREAQSDVLHEFNLAGSTLAEWFLPTEGVGEPDAIEGGVALVFLGVMAVPSLVEIYKLRTGQVGDTLRLVWLVMIWGSILVFTALLIFFSLLADFDSIGFRLLMPIYVLVLVLVLACFEMVGRWVFSRFLTFRQASWVVIGLFVAWLLFYPVTRFFDEASHFYRDCCGYQIWHEQPLIVWLQDPPFSGEYYANVPLPLYFGETVIEVPMDLASWEFRSSILPTEGYLVWFDQTDALVCAPTSRCFRANYTPEELSRIVRLEPVIQLDGGTVYHFSYVDGREAMQ